MSDWQKMLVLGGSILTSAFLITFAHVVLIQRTFVVRPADVQQAVIVVDKAVAELKVEVRLLRQAMEHIVEDE